jgi:hypothetical protein
MPQRGIMGSIAGQVPGMGSTDGALVVAFEPIQES